MRTKNLSQWISENKFASFFGGVFLLSIPVYTLIAYSSAISVILVTKISNRTKINCSGSNRLMLFAGTFGIFSAIEWIAHNRRMFETTLSRGLGNELYSYN